MNPNKIRAYCETNEFDKLLSIKMAYEDLVKSGKVDVDSVPW